MKITIGTLCLLASLNVSAGQYEAQAMINGICEGVGNAGVIGFQQKTKHKKLIIDPKIADLAKWAQDYGYNKASSEKDAYMMGWAHCQDDFEEYKRSLERP